MYVVSRVRQPQDLKLLAIKFNHEGGAYPYQEPWSGGGDHVLLYQRGLSGNRRQTAWERRQLCIVRCFGHRWLPDSNSGETTSNNNCITPKRTCSTHVRHFLELWTQVINILTYYAIKFVQFNRYRPCSQKEYLKKIFMQQYLAQIRLFRTIRVDKRLYYY